MCGVPLERNPSPEHVPGVAVGVFSNVLDTACAFLNRFLHFQMFLFPTEFRHNHTSSTSP